MGEERREIRRHAVVFLIIFVLFILLVPREREFYGGPVYGGGYGPGYY
ncbi:hypothetical protein [Alicyclobacillus macrosporangiidus]|jgi:uncharacterized membrane protein (DUF485 family)|uniref:Uncharacterized protein n=1 Tax=Alicyclobacillus macrosporangiidus TaxID=392015 RepID=A0A1I7LFW7_9BACL|nr:hypothetical protein [Alicyclobacillus macrosporangiidus]SFV08560.1 hypothetical protein SAMN05421543_1461 [Alicyclobacillus macrosporangiidus]